VRFEPAAGVVGELAPPPDKSLSHRAAIIAAMSDSATRVERYLRAADTESGLHAIAALGAEVDERSSSPGAVNLTIRGVGLRGARHPRKPIEVGNAGTLMRILPGWLAGQGSGHWMLDGDDSIRRRPVDRIAEPLRAMGARMDCRDVRFPPLEVRAARLHGIRYVLPVASAQVKSCVLLAGLLADGETTVIEPVPSRDHTERMLAAAGAAPALRPTGQGREISVRETEQLTLEAIEIPGDFSSAAFFLVAATLVPGSELRLANVGVNPTRTGLLDVLERMGARVERERERVAGGEPVADLVVTHASLRATSVEAGEVPLLIDELPLVALLGAFAAGPTTVSGAGELRHKESDRIATVVEAMRGLGADIEATEDGFVVEGGGALEGGRADSHGDHRLAMLGAVAGLASRSGAEVAGFEAAAVSYPGFGEDLRRVSGRGEPAAG
jgi:3-phosphoshikimate 1-carboxyvinyltransferase